MKGYKTSLYGTTNPKSISYKNDGHGRDLYVSNNSGGFIKSPRGRNSSSNSYNFNSNKIIYNYESPRNHHYYHVQKESNPIKYFCDGSGRDSYIHSNNGGFTRDHRSIKSIKLQDFLR